MRDWRYASEQSDTKGYNRGRVLGWVVRQPGISRSRLVEGTGLTSGAISRITRELINAGMVREGQRRAPQGKSGPPFVGLEAVPGGGYTLGLGIEASRQILILADLTGAIVRECALDVTNLADPEAVFDHAAEEIRALVRAAAIPTSRLFGLGVAAVGMVDPLSQTVIESAVLGWHGIAVGRMLRQRIGLPIAVDSLLHAINLAETRHGICRDVRNVVLLHTTLGIGASIIVDGKIARGTDFAAGQIGHVHVAAGGLGCLCGSSGCLNTVGSGRAVLASLGRLTEEGTVAQSFAQNLTALETALNGTSADRSAEARSVRNAGLEVGRYLGRVCGMLDPDMVVLAGTLGQHSVFRQGVEAGIAETVPAGRRLGVLTSQMRSEIAAALLALDEFALSEQLDLGALADKGASIAS